MATVYLAQDLRHDRKVALKVLRPELAAIMGGERFLAEIRTTANLQHPHILPLFDSGEAGGFLFFVMPYVEGESLRDRLDREGELPVEEAVRIAIGVANALDYAHRRGVIHRDIKPANILLHDGEPLVADFGIALAVSAAGGGRLTETGLSLGTPYYMSPEQATAERDPDPRSDVYALGCVLYEMLVGEPPYTGASAQAVLGKILTTDPVRPTEHRRAIPAHVEAVVLKALEKRPADRFGSAAELATALGDPRFRQGAGGSVAGVRAPVGKSRLWMPTALLALAAAAVVLVIHLKEASPWMHRLRYTIPLPEEGEAEGLYFHFRVSPDGRYMAVSGVIEKSSGIFVREMDSSEWRVLAGTGVSDFFWSPDSRTIAFFEEGKLRRVGVDGGPVEDLADARSINQFEASGTWSSGGMVVFSAAQTGSLMSVPAAGGRPMPLTEAEAGVGHRYPAFLPDGEHLLYTVRGGDNPGVYVLGFNDPEGRRLLPDLSSAVFAPAEGSGGTGHLVFGREGRLMAQPFDSDALEFVGDAFMVAERALWSDHGGTAVSASDNGILVYLGGRNRKTDSRLVWIDREGTALDRVGPVGSESAVALSVDGRTAALVRQSPGTRTGDVWVRDLGRSREDPLTFDGRVATFSNAVLAPEGDRVAYVWTDQETAEIRIAPVQGPGPGEAVASAEGSSLNPTDWSTGGYLVYTRIDAQTGSDLWYLRMEDGSDGFGEAVPFRQDPFQTSSGQVSPSGEWIAYVSDETGSMEIWVESFPSGPGRWRVSESQNPSGTTQQPRWSASGRELFYSAGAGGRTLMMAPFAPTSSGSPVGEPRPLFDARINSYAPQLGTFFYDVSSDGDRFLVSLVDRPEDAMLNVLVNWQQGRQ